MSRDRQSPGYDNGIKCRPMTVAEVSDRHRHRHTGANTASSLSFLHPVVSRPLGPLWPWVLSSDVCLAPVVSPQHPVQCSRSLGDVVNPHHGWPSLSCCLPPFRAEKNEQKSGTILDSEGRFLARDTPIGVLRQTPSNHYDILNFVYVNQRTQERTVPHMTPCQKFHTIRRCVCAIQYHTCCNQLASIRKDRCTSTPLNDDGRNDTAALAY